MPWRGRVIHLPLLHLIWRVRWWDGPRRSLLQWRPFWWKERSALTNSGTALKGALCDVGLFLTASGTALTGGPSIFILALFHCRHNTKAPQAPRFPEKEKGLRHRKIPTENSKTEPQGNPTEQQETQSGRKHEQEHTQTQHNHSQHLPPVDRKSQG